jgi:hypothetical protein
MNFKLVSIDPLKYENDEGQEMPLKEVTCPIHYGIIKYVEDGEEKLPVVIPDSEDKCESWRGLLKQQG